MHCLLKSKKWAGEASPVIANLLPIQSPSLLQVEYLGGLSQLMVLLELIDGDPIGEDNSDWHKRWRQRVNRNDSFRTLAWLSLRLDKVRLSFSRLFKIYKQKNTCSQLVCRGLAGTLIQTAIQLKQKSPLKSDLINFLLLGRSILIN